MSDLKPVKLYDICILEKGQQIDTSLLDDSKPYRYINGGIKESGYYDDFNTSGESVLISEGGASCGYINYVNENFWCGCHCYRLHDIKVFPKYLFHALKANQQRIMALRTGSAMPNIQKSTIQKFELKIHDDINTQKKVSSMLDKCNELIEKHKLTLEKYDSLIKSRFIEMFGSENDFSKWNCCFVEDVADVTVGVVIKPTQYYCEKGIPAFRSLNIGEMKVNDSDWVYFTEEGNERNRKSILKENDVLVVRSGAPGKSCVITKKYEGYNVVDAIIAHPNLEKVNPVFLCMFTNMPHGMNQIKAKTGGAAQQHFNVGGYNSLKIILPPLSLQNDFAAFVQQIDKSKFEYKSTGVAA